MQQYWLMVNIVYDCTCQPWFVFFKMIELKENVNQLDLVIVDYL